MKGDKLIYFFNCYFLMLDYDEPLEKIVRDYIEKENDNNDSDSNIEFGYLGEDDGYQYTKKAA